MSDEPTAEDDFGKFFDNLSSLAAEKKPVPRDFGASDVVVQPVADPVGTAVSADAPTAEVTDDSVAPVSVEPAGDTPGTAREPVGPSATVAEVPVRSGDAALLERLVDAIDRRQVPAGQPQQPQLSPLYTAEQIAKMQAVDKDYPDVAEYVQLLLRGQTVQNNAYLMNRINEVIAPTQQIADTVASNYHRDSIYRAIPDYDNVYDPVINWVATDRSLPPYLREAYKGVIANGEVGEVTHLVNEWRKATGTSVSKSAQPAAPAKPANELSEATKQAAASLAPVVSRATAVVTSADPSKQDFDGGWDWAISQKRA